MDDEAEIIRMIFTSYAEGNSYETLAEWLNNGRHPYSPGKRWNKNTLARILQDERYLGNSVYPAILASGAFQRRKPTASGKLNHPQIKDIRILARCAVCGMPIQRERTDTWRCPHCMTLAVNSTDKRLMDSVAEEFKRISADMAALKTQRADLLEQQNSDSAASQRIANAMEILKTGDAAIQWEESTIRQLVDTVKVLSANRIRIYLHGGIEIEQELVD